MGFLNIGERSVPRRASSKRANETGDVDNATAKKTRRIESIDMAQSSGTGSQKLSPMDADMHSGQHANIQSPTSFIDLPVELLQRIFFMSYNPSLPLTCHALLSALSSPYIQEQLFCSIVLDDLSDQEYREHMAVLLTRRFVTSPFIQRVESLLWARKFASVFEAETYGRSFTSENQDPYLRAITFNPSSEWWKIRYGNSDHYLPAIKHRMVDGRLDLRTIRISKAKLQPPWSPQKIQFLLDFVYRNPLCYMSVVSGRGKEELERLLEYAIRTRCASMVYLLVNNFYALLRADRVIMALLAPTHGDTTHLSDYPDISEHQFPEKDDLDTLGKLIDNLNQMHPNFYKAISVNFMSFQEDLKKPKYIKGQRDSFRVVFAMFALDRAIPDQHGTNVMSDRRTGFPGTLCRSILLRNYELWTGAIREKGWLLEFLLALAEPPVRCLVELEKIGAIDSEEREAAEEAEELPGEWREQEGEGYDADGLQSSFQEMWKKYKINGRKVGELPNNDNPWHANVADYNSNSEEEAEGDQNW